MKQYDVIALGELLIDFAPYSTNEAGYPILSAKISWRHWPGTAARLP